MRVLRDDGECLPTVLLHVLRYHLGRRETKERRDFDLCFGVYIQSTSKKNGLGSAPIPDYGYSPGLAAGSHVVRTQRHQHQTTEQGHRSGDIKETHPTAFHSRAPCCLQEIHSPELRRSNFDPGFVSTRACPKRRTSDTRALLLSYSQHQG